MGIASRPSRIVIPSDCNLSLTVFEFLCRQFPAVDASVWRTRITLQKVHWNDGELINLNTLCRPQEKVCYYREIAKEVEVPFKEAILFEDEHILVACKPHFLPVVPSGAYVENCLLNRLINTTGIETLNPAHRIDRDTAGLVLFSKVPSERRFYQGLFAQGCIEKSYQAVVRADQTPEHKWHEGSLIENRIVEGEPQFRRKVTNEGAINARSWAKVMSFDANLRAALFLLKPLTGKTHQLRVHMASVGHPLVNDPYYPVLKPKAETLSFDHPLQLLAKTLDFTDPVTQESRRFETARQLNWPISSV
jgi:tRNA pseudouridine32 synthase/23S rRNA pseudouridine746 synthase